LINVVPILLHRSKVFGSGLGSSQQFDYGFRQFLTRINEASHSQVTVGVEGLDASSRHATFLAPSVWIYRHRRVMKNAVRALQASIAVGAALILVAPSAQADVLDEIVVAHRAGATTKYGEGTLKSYKFSVANHADILDGDIHWTKDGSDKDSVGSIVVIHDSTLDRITNCKGKVSSWLWSSIYKKCRTDVGNQRLIRLKDLVAYGDSEKKQVAIGLKNSKITNAQAKQLWNTIKSSNVQLEAPASRLDALNKVKKLDKADPNHKIKYALVAIGSGGWGTGAKPNPSVSKVKSVGIYFHAEKSIPASVMSTYKKAGIKVFLFTGKTKSDYKKMAALDPHGVVVDDVAKFQAWRKTQI
jgi:glycerophosphoryl diester phosphodiesterase